MPSIRLKPKADKAVGRRHPWLFSGAIAHVEGNPKPGSTVDVYSSDGQWQARAAFSPQSQIRARVWTWDEAEQVNADFLRSRIEASIQRRGDLAQSTVTNAYREVFAESDGLPGLIVDRYGPYRVIQLLSAGVERWRDTIVDLLAGLGSPVGILERSDVDVRALEGLPPRVEVLWGEVPSDGLEIIEHGLEYKVDLFSGHKTGFYLDQRPNRLTAQKYLAVSKVLNCFAYTGGFTLCALRAGAEEVLSIDTSESALELARSNVVLNQFDLSQCRWSSEDVFEELRRLRDHGEQFDAIVLDPPRFAASSRQVRAAARGYKDINLLAFKLLKPGGRLMTFSCSGNVDEDLFQKIVAGAALDAGVNAYIEARLSQGEDHPILLSFPESRYLKGLVCRTW